MAHVQLAFLGSFSVVIDKKPVLQFRTEKARALLAYVALQPANEHSRRAVAALLWPESSPQQSSANMRITVYRLRNALNEVSPGACEQILDTTRRALYFNHGAADIDVTRLQGLLAAVANHDHREPALCGVCRSNLESAVGLYKGELLSDLAITDAPAFDEWLTMRREAVALQAFKALIALTTAYEACGQVTEATTHSQHLVALDPFQDEAQRQLIRLLALQGLNSQALVQFDRFRDLCRAELNAEPAHATQELAEAIRRGEFHGQIDLSGTMPGAWSVEATKEESERRESGAVEHHTIWSDVPEPGPFFGRQHELDRLQSRLLYESCRVVAILGIGGVGKSTLMLQATHAVGGHYDVVIWRSLLNAPPLDELLLDLLQLLCDRRQTDLPDTHDKQLALLSACFRSRHTLILLDNLESILEDAAAGSFRPGYEAYGQLLRRMVDEPNSQLIFTSRERPHGFSRLEGDTPYVRSLQLDGLDTTAARGLLASRGMSGTVEQESELVERYSGNPLALKLVADTVEELFAGNLSDFLTQETLIFDDIRTVLDQQFTRLVRLEQEILLWLAVLREPVPIRQLRAYLLPAPPQRRLVEALRNLQRRSLIEQSYGESSRFGLQNVVMEYLTNHLVESAVYELSSGEVELLHRHALLVSRAKETVRQSQTRLLLQPVAESLTSRFGRAGLRLHLQDVLDRLRADGPAIPSYAGGTILNLLLSSEMDVTGYNFSRLSVWQASLENRVLEGLNFEGADLTDSTFTQTFGRIEAVAIDPDGRLLAAGGDAGEIRIYGLGEVQPILVLREHVNTVTTLAFSPDGTLLASAGFDRNIRLWDVAEGRVVRSLDVPSPVCSVAFDPAGILLAIGGIDGVIRLWDVKSGQLQGTLDRHSERANAVTFHPEGSFFASAGSDGYIHLWDYTGLQEGHGTSTNEAGHQPVVHVRAIQVDEPVLSLVFSGNDSVVAGTYSGSIMLWHVENGHLKGTLSGHTGEVWSLACNRRAHHIIASGSYDRTVRLWDSAKGSCIKTLEGHDDTIWSLAYSPDGAALVSGGEDGTLRLWDVAQPEQAGLAQVLHGYLQAAQTLDWSPDGRRLAVGDVQGKVRLWDSDLAMPRCRYVLDAHHATRSLAFSPDGTILASVGEDTQNAVRLWDPAEGKYLGSLHGHATHATFVAFAPDSATLASSGRDGSICLWDVTDPTHGTLRRRLEGHTGNITSLSFAAGTSLFASCASDNTVRLWDLETFDEIQRRPGFGSNAFVRFDPHSRLLACAGPQFSILLLERADLTAKSPPIQLFGHTNFPNAVAFSPDGTLLASGSLDRTVRLWDVANGRQRCILGDHAGYVMRVAFSPDGTTVASAGNEGAVRVWQVETGRCLHVLRAPGPYRGINITGVTGITEAQRASLLALGAIEGRTF